MATRSIKLKTKSVAANGLPTVTLQHPSATVGIIFQNDYSMIVTHEIINIPDGVTDADVIRAWRETCDLTWLCQPEGRHVFDFTEIGSGVIICK